MTAVDRFADGYEPSFDIDAEFGNQAALFVGGVVDGIAHGLIEVKSDARALDTNRVYVEYECCRAGGWNLSGIATTEAAWWALVLGPRQRVLLVLPTDVVKSLARDAVRAGRTAECMRGSHPTRGAIVELAALLVTGLDRAERTP